MKTRKQPTLPDIVGFSVTLKDYVDYYGISTYPGWVRKHIKEEYEYLLFNFKGQDYLYTDMVTNYPPTILLKDYKDFYGYKIQSLKLIKYKTMEGEQVFKELCTIEDYSKYWGMNKDLFETYLLGSPYCRSFWQGERLLVSLGANPFLVFNFCPNQFCAEPDRSKQLIKCFGTQPDGSPNIITATQAQAQKKEFRSREAIFNRYGVGLFKDKKNRVPYNSMAINQPLFGYYPMWLLDDMGLDDKGMPWEITLVYPRDLMEILYLKQYNYTRRKKRRLTKQEKIRVKALNSI